MPRPVSRRPAFTLIEVLATIAIVLVLAAMTFSLYGYVQNARREARARGEIALLKTKLEEFKNLYGEYPMATDTNAESWQKTLFDALTGRKVLVRDTAATTSVKPKFKWEEIADTKKQRPLVDLSLLTSDSVYNQSTELPKWFVDPWGNPYQYRYGKLSNGRPDVNWDNPGFLIISAGVKFSEPFDAARDCFEGDMDATGKVDTVKYFEDATGLRNDNLTNFGDK